MSAEAVASPHGEEQRAKAGLELRGSERRLSSWGEGCASRRPSELWGGREGAMGPEGGSAPSSQGL